MKGSTFRHEFVQRRDGATGKTVTQLTSLPGNHHHLYFTSSSFTADNQEVLFISDQSGGHPNLFKMSLEDGIAVQLTDNRDGYMKSYVYYDGQLNRGLAKASPSYNPGSHKLLYIQHNRVHLMDLNTLSDEVIYSLPMHVMTGFTHISADGRWVCIPYIDASAFEVGEGNPFTLIRDKVYRKLIESRLLVIDTHTGSSEIRCSHVGWVTHVQFHPLNPDRILFNHEGGMVEQRMWLFDNRSGVVSKVRDQADAASELWICHEMWIDQGNAVLYHGTQGVPNDPAMKDEGKKKDDIISFVGRIDLESGIATELSFSPEMDSYGHFTSSSRGDLLVTDGVIDNKSIHLCQPNWEEGRLSITQVCQHNSSFMTQDVHPHPIFSHDDRHILFTSDSHNEQKKGNLYLVDLKQEDEPT
ncbi:oligogalacturonate lyase family protein [Paenibacillus sp. 32352]|uniref:oligogalacturonate lyase family protein n=1 Tax=Paenibacillus sp. 32352 TaxID=1969111 RepID=UPI0009ADAE6B|nr:oligogalacturonate lyase family protein [Paenibacillus sp. 32352]